MCFYMSTSGRVLDLGNESRSGCIFQRLRAWLKELLSPRAKDDARQTGLIQQI